ncbi:hypothetical protein [Streptosporangium carneum]|uniref:Lipoprotein LpqB beta-propeller domain-containing protein n=1 Tax=Streptosporangium carneum TaxID=47481 RepID=A0A9W6I5D1_9ACTN|nr:hypothetical protein [Streptosporangium carneum]GLK11988.1 hypothetical protein GCM10017600_53960 [Streptosporangium carneum]
MTRLREALDDIAGEAPMVSLPDLADLAVAGHRRRRRVTTALAVVATVVALGAGSATVALTGLGGDHTAAPQRVDTVPDLPEGRVGPLSHAYQTGCKVDERRRPDCSATEWRVVTRTGTTYRVPQALIRNVKERRVPVSISRDGRMLAYYSRQAQAHVVRDLTSGSVVTSPVTVKEERIGTGSMLVVSDDGRYVVFDPREGTKEPGLLIDMRTGKTVSIPGEFEAVSVRGGVAELVRYIKTDLWLMPVTGGGTPVRFDGVFIMFSELAPDGRTVAAFEIQGDDERVLTLLDARTGRTLRRVITRGLPKDGGVLNTALWLSGSEVTLVSQDKGAVRAYAVNVTTGQARQVARYSNKLPGLTLPGAVSSGY